MNRNRREIVLVALGFIRRNAKSVALVVGQYIVSLGKGESLGGFPVKGRRKMCCWHLELVCGSYEEQRLRRRRPIRLDL